MTLKMVITRIVAMMNWPLVMMMVLVASVTICVTRGTR